MAWSAPLTAVVNEVFTSSQWNTYVRDNFLELAPAKATTSGRWMVSETDATVNNLVERQVASDVATSNTFISAGGSYEGSDPSVTLNTGAAALVFFSASMSNTAAGGASYVSFQVEGQTTIPANDNWSLFTADVEDASRVNRMGMSHLFTGLNVGENTFSLNYRSEDGTSSFSNREIIVVGM